MRTVLIFTDEYIAQSPNLEEISDILENFWLHYSVYVQKVIDGYDDETRSLWLEHLIITGKENFVKDEINENEHSEPLDLMILELTSGLSEISKKYFNVFIREIFLANARIVYDSAGQFCKCSDNINTNSYLFDMWNKFMKIDLGYIEKTPDYLKKQLQLECELFDFLNKNNGSSEEDAIRGGIIKNRYDQLLKSIKDLVTQKYNLKYDDIHIAILTVGNGNKHNLRLHDFEMISETFGLDYNNDYANYKYIIKQRVSKALSKSDSKKELERYGYFLIKEPETSEKNTDNYRVPYFILSFCISDKMLNADIELKPIVPVYMYVSIMADSHPQKNILPWFIMRDILTRRNLLNKYFVADFTSDVLQRYAHSVGTEAVLKTEKEISHSPLKNDFIHLEQIWSMKNDFEQNIEKMHDATVQLSREKMLMWFAARNFCNTMTARLHNRVLRNINKDFGEIIDESSKQNDKKEGVKLYVDYNTDDGFSTPLQTVNDILPSSNDIIFELLKEIISFKGLDDIDHNRKAVTRDYNNKSYTYNLDYVKNIIYRICFDALRFSRGSGAECGDFIARIKNHYAFLRIKSAQNNGNRFKKIVDLYQNEVACEMCFSVEEASESQHFDWLVIKNKLFKKDDSCAVTASIIKKLGDPLDFSDGHMSLIAQKEFLTQLYGRDEEEYINSTMYNYDDDNEYFITRLPIISKWKGEC